MRTLSTALSLSLSLVLFSLAGCEALSNNNSGDAAAADTTTAQDTVSDTSPQGPVTLSPASAPVGLERKNNSQGSPEYHADLCMSGGRDPRNGVELKRGKACIDSLIVRFFIPKGASTGQILWSPNFTGITSSAGTINGSMRAVEGVPIDGSAVSVTLDTVANQIPGGARVRLEFDVELGPGATGSGATWTVAIDEVVITTL